MSNKKSKGRYTLARMRPIVAGYSTYTGTKKDYCDQFDLNIHTFDYWRKRVKELSAAKQPLPASSSFIELSPAGGSDQFTLHLPDGKRLDIPLGVPASLLHALLQL